MAIKIAGTTVINDSRNLENITSINGTAVSTFLTSASLDISTESLGDLSNVSATAPSTGEVLKWDGSTWAPAADAEGTTISSINDISDVTVTTVGSGEVLVWSGSEWANQTLVEAGIASAAQGALADSALQSFTETNDLSAAVTWADVPTANIVVGAVTQHQAALTITESQISDLGTYLTGVSEAQVTAHEAALTVTESQISDLQSYLTAVSEGSVTAHQAALTITESQISDLGTYETADATILKDADIGVNVQAYDANLVSDATYVATENDFTTVLKNKLDGIEAGAGAPNATNVEAAGALMDSEVTNLADVKAFDPADYATAAQGTLAASALQSYTVTQGDVTGHQAALSITESQISDFGTYETADSTILKDADIGVNVQAYDANLVSDATYVATANDFTTALKNKLDAIEVSATADQTKADIEGLGIAFSSLSAKPTTIAGYGITDASTTAEMNTAIDTAITAITGAAPAALNTLTELADALGDDADFAATMTTSLAGKLSLTGGALTGAVTTTSTIDGRDVSVDGTKLDGIEALADVTDTANVTAAGALMDSEVTNLAEVKAFAAADYATAAQGTKADTALQSYTVSQGDVTAHEGALSITESQISDFGSYETADATILKDADIGVNVQAYNANLTTANQALASTDAPSFAGMALSGNLTTSGNIDGRDVAADGTKLDGVQADLATTDTPTFAGLDLTGNLTTTGTIDGRDIAADGTKLDNIQSGLGTTDTPTFGATTINGDITTTGTVDGRDVAADGTKLDTVASNADVTDAASVAAAGGLMDSEITNLAAVKAFDPADYATAAQGTLAASALQSVPAQSFSSLTGKPTTIAGYGISDAFDGAYGSLSGTPTIPTSNSQLSNGAGYITGYTVTQGDVTGHQAALSITESQISDFGTYNNYVHPTSNGNKHIPSDGTAGQILQYAGSAGTAEWVDPSGGLDSQSATLSTTSQSSIATYNAAATDGVKVFVKVVEGTKRHVTELLVCHDGTTAIATEYGTIFTNASLATFDVDISSGNLRILATGADSTSKTYTVTYAEL